MKVRSSKTTEVIKWLKRRPDFTSEDIARAVGCHSGFVRAVKGRLLKPERSAAYCRRYYQENPAYRQRKIAWSRYQTATGKRRKTEEAMT